MRASAQINQRTTAIDSTLFSSHKLVNVMHLVFAVAEHLFQVLFRNLQPIETLLLLEDLGCFTVERRPIAFPNSTAIHCQLWPCLI